MVLTKISHRQKGCFIASNCSNTGTDERFQVSYWRFVVAGSQCSSKSSLQPQDGCVHSHMNTPASTKTHISPPASLIYHSADSPAQRVKSYTSFQCSLTKIKLLAGFTFMKPVDLCSLHLPRGFLLYS